MSARHPETRTFLVRHGESRANKAEKIASRARGLFLMGLTDHGREQVKLSVENFAHTAIEEHTLTRKDIEDMVIVTSPWARARQTAKIVRMTLAKEFDIPVGKMKSVRYAWGLRERNFGTFEWTSSSNYQRVWALDPTHQEQLPSDFASVESVSKVRERVVKVIQRYQDRYPDRIVFFVGHEDPLKIGQTYFESVEDHGNLRQMQAGEHRKLPLMKNGEIRQLPTSTF